MYVAFMLARNAGLRDAEIRTLSLGQIDLKSKSLQLGHAKSNAGTNQIIPMNSNLYEALVAHREWYADKVEATKDESISFRWAGPYARPLLPQTCPTIYVPAPGVHTTSWTSAQAIYRSLRANV